MENNEITELPQKYRPRDLDDVVGQSSAVAQLEGMLKKGFPHALLLSGPSGVGKTTIARILRKRLKVHPDDYKEMNAAADARGIDTIREIIGKLNYKGRAGKPKIFYFDEAHKLTGDAQTGMLKVLEDSRTWIYFFLATTDPQKIIPTVRSRCKWVKLEQVADDIIVDLIEDVRQKEGGEPVSEEVRDAIIEAAGGSAREALQMLEQVLAVDPAEQLQAITAVDAKKQAIDLCRVLMNTAAKWPDVAKVLKSLDADPEQVRRAVLGYASAVVANGAIKPRAVALLESFECNFFDSGKAGLVLACTRVFSSR